MKTSRFCHIYATLFWPSFIMLPNTLKHNHVLSRERSGSVVKCLTQDRRAAGLSLTRVTALCPWARYINPSLVLVQLRKTRFDVTERLLTKTLRIKTNKQCFIDFNTWHYYTTRGDHHMIKIWFNFHRKYHKMSQSDTSWNVHNWNVLGQNVWAMLVSIAEIYVAWLFAC